MPEKRIREIVVETVSYSVRAGEAKKAAAANKKYATIIESHTTEHDGTPYVTISKAPRGQHHGVSQSTAGRSDEAA